MAKQLCSNYRLLLIIWKALHTSVINGIVLSGHAKVVEMDTYNQKGKSWFMPLFIIVIVQLYFITLVLF